MRSILIIGASGNLGLALIHSTAEHLSKPSVHAFVRTSSRIPPKEAALCATIQHGDALSQHDIKRALEVTHADTVIIAIGVRNSTAKSNLRENSARALIEVIRPGSPFEHIRVVCISSLGAGGSRILLGFGIGKLIRFNLRHVLRDHDMQEEVLIRGMGSKNANRLLIIRPTSLTDGNPGRKVVRFGSEEKAPSFKIDREDVAAYIAEQVCGGGEQFGNAVNVDTAPK